MNPLWKVGSSTNSIFTTTGRPSIVWMRIVSSWAPLKVMTMDWIIFLANDQSGDCGSDLVSTEDSLNYESLKLAYLS
jgi:hypothetical protein